MIKQCVVQNGKVIHIGAWDVTEQVGDDVVAVPLPDGAVEGDFDLTETADGRIVLAEDYRQLRAAEYPPIGDQLDALFQAGLFPAEMASLLQLVKDKHPKP